MHWSIQPIFFVSIFLKRTDIRKAWFAGSYWSRRMRSHMTMLYLFKCPNDTSWLQEIKPVKAILLYFVMSLSYIYYILKKLKKVWLPLRVLHSSSNVSIHLSMHSESLLTTSQSNVGRSSGGLIPNSIHPCLFQREPESIKSVMSSSAFCLFGLFSPLILTRLHTPLFYATLICHI